MKKLDPDTDLLELKRKPVTSALSDLKQLSDLTLVDYPDESLPEGVVLKRLDYLTIEKGALVRLPRDVDVCWPRVCMISLDRVPLMRLPLALAKLDVIELKLANLPDLQWGQALGVMARCKKLGTLEIEGADFSGGLPAFEKLTQVIYLSLINCRLPAVPARLSRMTALSHLMIERCKLREPLPDALVLKPNLKAIYYALNPNSRSEAARVKALRPKLKFEV